MVTRRFPGRPRVNRSALSLLIDPGEAQVAARCQVVARPLGGGRLAGDRMARMDATAAEASEGPPGTVRLAGAVRRVVCYRSPGFVHHPHAAG